MAKKKKSEKQTDQFPGAPGGSLSFTESLKESNRKVLSNLEDTITKSLEKVALPKATRMTPRGRDVGTPPPVATRGVNRGTELGRGQLIQDAENIVSRLPSEPLQFEPEAKIEEIPLPLGQEVTPPEGIITGSSVPLDMKERLSEGLQPPPIEPPTPPPPVQSGEYGLIPNYVPDGDIPPQVTQQGIDILGLQDKQKEMESELAWRERMRHMPNQLQPADLSKIFPADLYQDYIRQVPITALDNKDLSELNKTVEAIVENRKSIKGKKGGDVDAPIDFTPQTYQEVIQKYQNEELSFGQMAAESIGESLLRNALFMIKRTPATAGLGTLLNYAIDYTPTSEQIDRINAAIIADPQIGKLLGVERFNKEELNVGQEVVLGLGTLIPSLMGTFRTSNEVVTKLAPFLNAKRVATFSGLEKVKQIGVNIGRAIPRGISTFVLQEEMLNQKIPHSNPFVSGAAFEVSTAISGMLTEMLPKQFRLASVVKPLTKVVMGGMGFASGEMAVDYLTQGELKEMEDYIPAFVMGGALGGWHSAMETIQIHGLEKTMNTKYGRWVNLKNELSTLDQIITDRQNEVANIKDAAQYKAESSQLLDLKTARQQLAKQMNTLETEIKAIGETVDKSPIPKEEEGQSGVLTEQQFKELQNKEKARQTLRSAEETFDKDFAEAKTKILQNEEKKTQEINRRQSEEKAKFEEEERKSYARQSQEYTKQQRDILFEWATDAEQKEILTLEAEKKKAADTYESIPTPANNKIANDLQRNYDKLLEDIKTRVSNAEEYHPYGEKMRELEAEQTQLAKQRDEIMLNKTQDDYSRGDMYDELRQSVEKKMAKVDKELEALQKKAAEYVGSKKKEVLLSPFVFTPGEFTSTNPKRVPLGQAFKNILKKVSPSSAAKEMELGEDDILNLLAFRSYFKNKLKDLSGVDPTDLTDFFVSRVEQALTRVSPQNRSDYEQAIVEFLFPSTKGKGLTLRDNAFLKATEPPKKTEATEQREEALFDIRDAVEEITRDSDMTEVELLEELALRSGSEYAEQTAREIAPLVSEEAVNEIAETNKISRRERTSSETQADKDNSAQERNASAKALEMVEAEIAMNAKRMRDVEKDTKIVDKEIEKIKLNESISEKEKREEISKLEERKEQNAKTADNLTKALQLLRSEAAELTASMPVSKDGRSYQEMTKEELKAERESLIKENAKKQKKRQYDPEWERKTWEFEFDLEHSGTADKVAVDKANTLMKTLDGRRAKLIKKRDALREEQGASEKEGKATDAKEYQTRLKALTEEKKSLDLTTEEGVDREEQIVSEIKNLKKLIKETDTSEDSPEIAEINNEIEKISEEILRVRKEKQDIEHTNVGKKAGELDPEAKFPEYAVQPMTAERKKAFAEEKKSRRTTTKDKQESDFATELKVKQIEAELNNRSIEDKVDILEQFFGGKNPKARAEEWLNNFHEQMFGEVGAVKIVKTIMDNDSPVDAVGYYKNKVIQVLYDIVVGRASEAKLPYQAVYGHEAFHMLKDNFLTTAQKRYLDKRTVVDAQHQDKIDAIQQELTDGMITKEQFEDKVSRIKEEIQATEAMEMIRDGMIDGHFINGKLTDKGRKALVYAVLLDNVGRFLRLNPYKSTKQLTREMLLGKFKKSPTFELEQKIMGGKTLTKEDYYAYLGKTPEEVQKMVDDKRRTKDIIGVPTNEALRKTEKQIQKVFPNESPENQEKLALGQFKGKRGVQKDKARQAKAADSRMTEKRLLNWKEGVLPNDVQYEGAMKIVTDQANKVVSYDLEGIKRLSPEQQAVELAEYKRELDKYIQLQTKRMSMLSEAGRLLRLGNAKHLAEGYMATMENMDSKKQHTIATLEQMTIESQKRLSALEKAKETGVFEGKKLTLEEIQIFIENEQTRIKSIYDIHQGLLGGGEHKRQFETLIARMNKELSHKNRTLTERQVGMLGQVWDRIWSSQHSLRIELDKINSGRATQSAILGYNVKLSKTEETRLNKITEQLLKDQAEFYRLQYSISPPSIRDALSVAYRMNIMGVQTLATNLFANMGFHIARVMDGVGSGLLLRTAKIWAESTKNSKLQKDINTLLTKPTASQELTNWITDFKNTFAETLRSLGDTGLTQEFYEKTEIKMHRVIDPMSKFKQATGSEPDLIPALLNTNKGVAKLLEKYAGLNAEKVQLQVDKGIRMVEAILEAQPLLIAKGLTLGDRPFYAPEYNRQLTRTIMQGGERSVTEARRQLQLASDEVKTKAHKKALEAIYAEANIVSQLYNQAMTRIESSPKLVRPVKDMLKTVMEVLVPFSKIPINVARRFVNYAIPIYPLTKGLLELNQSKYLGGEARTDMINQGIRNLAMASTGAMLQTMGAILESSGVISATWDKNQKNQNIQRPPNTLNITMLTRMLSGDTDRQWKDGDRLLKMEFLGVPGLVMNVGATAFRNARPEETRLYAELSGDYTRPPEEEGMINEMLQYGMAMPGAALKLSWEQTALFGLSTVVTAIEQNNFDIPKLQYILASVASAPFASKTAVDIADSFGETDDYMRDVKYNPDYSATMKRLGSLGGMFGETPSEALPYFYNVAGQKVKSRGRKLKDAYITETYETTPEMDLIRQAYIRTQGDRTVIPPKPKPTFTYKDPEGTKTNKRHSMEQYEKYQQLAGEKRTKLLPKFLEQYDNAPDLAAKNKLITGLSTKYGKARKEALKETPKLILEEQGDE